MTFYFFKNCYTRFLEQWSWIQCSMGSFQKYLSLDEPEAVTCGSGGTCQPNQTCELVAE